MVCQVGTPVQPGTVVPDFAIGLPFRKQDGKCNDCQQVLGDVNSIKLPFVECIGRQMTPSVRRTQSKPLPIPPRYRVSDQNRQSLEMACI